MGWIQWGAFVFSIIYVLLAARENIWCWFFGLISVILAFIVYIDPEVRLYSDALLQVFYAVMSIYGWWSWRARPQMTGDQLEIEEVPLSISTWSIKEHLLAIILGTGLSFMLGWMWSQFGAALPYIDAFTSAFSIIATLMVTRKILENWLYWIVIDFVCIFVYIHRELYLFSLLFFIYCIIAIVGYINWRREYKVNLI